MPVSGKEELRMQSSSSLTGIPIKKRRFPFVLPSSSPPEEPTSFHDESNLKNGESGSTQRSSFNPIDTAGSASKSDASKNPLLEVKQEKPGGAHVSFGQPIMDSSGSKLAEADKTSVQSTEEPPGSKPTEADNTSIQFTKEPFGSKVTEADVSAAQSFEEPSGSKATETNASSLHYVEGPSGSKPTEMDVTAAQPNVEPSGSKPADTNVSSVHNMEEPSGSKPAEKNVSFVQSAKDPFRSKSEETNVASVQPSKEPCGMQLSEANITSAQTNEESLESKVQVTNTKICSGSTNSADNCVKGALTGSSLEVAENISVNVKMENIGKQAEGSIKFQSSAHSGNTELSLGLQRQNLPLGVQNRGGSEMPDNLDPSLLSLSLNKEKAIDSQIGRSNSRSNDDSPDTDTNRSNWDLNTTMDAWEGSGNGFQDTDNIDALSKISTRHDLKPSLSSFSMLGACNDKGKQISGVSEQISSIQSSQSEDSLFLSLGSPFNGLDSSKRHFGSMTKADSIPHTSVPRTITNMNSVGCGTVKVEPIDESSKQDYAGSSNNAAKALDGNSLKMEHVERGNMEPVEFPIKCAEKLIEKKSIKSEPLQETNQESCRMSSMTLHQSVGNVVPSKESSSTLPVPLTPEKLLSTRMATFSELSVSGELSNQSEHSVHTKEVYAMNAGIAIQNENSALKGLNASCSKVDACGSEGVKIDSLEMSQLKQVNEHHQALVASCEGSVSGEQDMNISVDMEEEQPYGSDYESDGNHACTVHTDVEGRPCGKEDDDYEDGEVREPILQSTEENTIALGTDSKKIIDSDIHAMAASTDDNNVQSGCDEKDETAMIYHEAINDCSKECGGGTVCDKIVDQVLGKDGSLSTSISENVPATCSYDSMPVNATQQIHFDQAGAKDRQEENIEGVLCDGALDASNDMRVTVTKISVEDANGTNDAEKLNSSLANAETPLNGNSAKDSSAIKSRIINLPRTSNSTSPSKARSIMGRPLSSRSGRERYFDAQDERLHLSGNRGEMYTDGSNKYARERIRDRPYESSRVSFMRGRGRVSARFGRSHRDWDSERDFSFTRRDDYCFPRHKRAAAIDDAEVERNDFDIAPNGAVMGPSRGRKHLNGESPSFRHSSSRRLSPVDRGGHATMGIQILGRMPRNSSPSRCTDEDGSEFVGLRHGERFVRDLPTDIIDPVYRSDGQFVRGKKIFPPIQRRDFSRMRSKSPDGSQRHSPGPWTSHRRAMEGLDDLSELPQRRSPAMYRVDRMRSPECDYFSEEIVPRRRGSPYKSKSRRPRNAYSGRALFVEGGILSEWQRFDSTPSREKNSRGGNGNGSRNPASGSKNAAPKSSSGSGSLSRSESKKTRGNTIAYMYPSEDVQEGLASESSGEVKDVKSVGMHPIVLLDSKESKIVAYIDEGSNKEPQNMEHVYDYSTTCALGERPDVEHQEMECVYDYSTGFSVDENTHRGLGFYNEAEAMRGIGSSSKADEKEDSDFKSSSSDEDMDADVDVDGEMDDAADKLSPEENQGFLSIGGLRLYTHDISEEEDEEDDEDDLLEEETSGSSESGESTGSSDSDDSSDSGSEIDDEVAADYLESTGGIDHVVNVDKLVGKIQDGTDDDRLDETLEKLSGIALQEASREYGMKKHQSRRKSQGESKDTPAKYVWSSALDDLMLVKDPRTVSGRKKHAAKFPQSWPLESQKSKNFRRNPGEKKKHRKEMIASKRRERMIRRGVDLQKINAKLEKMVLDGADMLSFEPMHTKDCSQVRRLASVYRLWSGCQGSGKKRFVTVARTHHTCMPSANDRVRVEKLIGANDEDDDFTVNGVPANKPSRGSYTTSTPRDSKSSQIKSLKSLSSSGGNKDSSRKKRNGKTGSYSSQPVSFISSGIMSSEKVELKITESTESSDGCHEKKCVSNYGAFELHTTGFGSKMMVKMGFTGGGLGKDGQGIAEPIQVSQRPKTLGLGADIPETSTANETMTPTPKSVVFREDLPTRSRKSGQKGSQGQKAQYGSPGFGAFENHTKGFGSKMMAKMGFVEGTGLGKDSQGITAPILATRRPKSQGLGAKR